MAHLISREDIDHEGRQSENDDGIYFDDLEDGTTLELETQHHRYSIVKRAHGQARISGHPRFCPEPVMVEIGGSTPEGLIVKPGFIGRGMHLTFDHPKYHTVTTSRILAIHRIR